MWPVPAASAKACGSLPLSDDFLTEGLESVSLPENFCIIESRDTVQASRSRALGGALQSEPRQRNPPEARLPQDFAALRLEEIDDSITVRRNRIFLLMEEARAAGAGVEKR